jgi:hypothetical protein
LLCGVRKEEETTRRRNTSRRGASLGAVDFYIVFERDPSGAHHTSGDAGEAIDFVPARL